MKYILSEKKQVNIFSTINLIIASIYIFCEWMILDKTKDSIFVGMLLAGTIFVNYSMHKLYKDLKYNSENFYVYLYQDIDKEKNEKIDALKIRDIEINKIFNPKVSLIFASVFTVCFAVFTWQLLKWENMILKLNLILYLLSVNFTTGLGLFSLFKFIIISYNWCDKVIKDIWMINNKALKNLRSLKNKVLLTMSIYITICQSSILFSNIEIGYAVYLYTVFSVLLIIMAYMLPEYKIRNTARKLKDDVLEEFNYKISVEYRTALKVANEKNEKIELDKFNSLIEIKEKIILASENDFNIEAVISFVNIILISAFPVILQYLLEYIL